MNIAVVVTAHGNAGELNTILENMRHQTHRPFEVIVMASCISRSELDAVFEKYKKVFRYLWIHEDEDRHDWGHEKRSKGLQKVKHGKYLTFVNADDEYAPDFFDRLLDKHAEEPADIIYCNFHSHLTGSIINSYPNHGAITSGNFMIRTSLAKRIGWNHRVYEGDWEFINDCMKKGATFSKVDECLYFHR